MYDNCSFSALGMQSFGFLASEGVIHCLNGTVNR